MKGCSASICYIRDTEIPIAKTIKDELKRANFDANLVVIGAVREPNKRILVEAQSTNFAVRLIQEYLNGVLRLALGYYSEHSYISDYCEAREDPDLGDREFRVIVNPEI